MNSINDCFTMNNNEKIPCMGYGTFKVSKDNNIKTIQDAIKTGYRLFDTASLYETERALGEAIKNSGIPREEFYIETKLWIDEMGYENTKKALNASLKRLQMDYVDLYLIHWPKPEEDSKNWKEINIETWRAMEELKEEGKIKSLGCSNFLPHHLNNILDNCKIKPTVNQLELHTGYSQEAAVDFCHKNNIIPMAWSPLGRGRETALYKNDILTKLSKKYNKSIAQINLRFLLQKGIIPIPKAGSKEHMEENTKIFDFEIDLDDMWMLSCMPQTTGLGEHPDFNIPKKKSNPNQ